LKSVYFKYLGEDVEHPEAKVWKVEAIHVTTTRNRRKFTLTELKEAGRSLSFRPLDINHDMDRVLPFPENKTRHMSFNQEKGVVEGTISVADKETNFAIETKKIEAVSIEQIPTKETCNEVSCEQHGVAFIALGLLEKGVLPGDVGARITGAHEESAKIEFEPIPNLIVSDEQRTCKECTDNVPCHECFHAKKEFNEKVEKINTLIKISKENYPGKKEGLINWAISKVFPDGLNPTKAKTHTKIATEYYDSL
jgi:hypothetical protein